MGQPVANCLSVNHGRGHCVGNHFTKGGCGRERIRFWTTRVWPRAPQDPREDIMLTGWRDFDDTLRAFDLLQRRIDRAFGDWATPSPAGDRLRRRTAAAWPATNVFETKQAFVVKAEVPGV